MTAEIISVGTELLMGQIVDTNAAWLSKNLPLEGISLYHRETVGDNKERLSRIIEMALKRSDIIFTIGGLGPTSDDITKETVADVLNEELVLDDDSHKILTDFFKSINRPMPENNIKQVKFPKNGHILKNPVGTAPGCVFIVEDNTKTEANNKYVIVMPGPPREFKKMYKDEVMPFLKSINGNKETYIKSKIIKTFGIGESTLEETLKDLMKSTNPTVAPYIGNGDVMLRVTASSDKETIACDLVSEMENKISNILGDAIYGYEDDTLPKIIVDLLMKKNLTLSIAESCTGGMISKEITDIPGASQILLFDAVTYSNQAKEKILKVKKDTLINHGAVSKECAKEMVLGLKDLTNSDIAISVTGIAGPASDDSSKPVGLVYIGVSYKNNTNIHELNFPGDRQNVRLRTTLTALDLIRKLII